MRPAPFPIHLWSCYDRTLAGEDRTNNFAEAAHRRLQTIMGIDHPSIGRFLGELKQAQKLRITATNSVLQVIQRRRSE
uniref:Transposase n=1 Tax=Ditylenchus dipsaci TaxID=166011 RepID=A0A915CWS9_9BILA